MSETKDLKEPKVRTEPDGDGRMRFSRKAFFYGLLIVLSLMAGLLLWSNTPYGSGVSHDSIFYLTTAENLAAGAGVSRSSSMGELKPLVHFPPGYPLILSALLTAGIPAEQAPRLLNAVLLAANLGLVGTLVYGYTRRLEAALIGMILITASPVLLERHLMALSEPLFFAFGIATLAALAGLLTGVSRSRFWVAVLFSAAAPLIRYTGVALLAGAPLVVLLLMKADLLGRLKLAIGLGVATALPMLVWSVRNYRFTGSLTNRTFAVHLIDADTIRRLLDVFNGWFSPVVHSHWLEAGLLILIIGTVVLLALRELRRCAGADCRAPLMVLLAVIFSAVYLLLLLISLSFFDASTRIDDRILSPLYLMFTLTVALTAGYAVRGKARYALLVALMAIFLTGPAQHMLRQSADLLEQARGEGVGFNSQAWHQSEAIAWLRALPEDALIVTDQALVVYFLTEKPAHQLPEQVDPVKSLERPEYDRTLSELDRILQQPHGYLIMFGGEYSPFKPPEDFMGSYELIQNLSDAAIYARAPAN